MLGTEKDKEGIRRTQDPTEELQSGLFLWRLNVKILWFVKTPSSPSPNKMAMVAPIETDGRF